MLGWNSLVGGADWVGEGSGGVVGCFVVGR